MRRYESPPTLKTRDSSSTPDIDGHYVLKFDGPQRGGAAGQASTHDQAGPLAGLTIQPRFDPSSPSLARQIYPPPRERGADRRPVYTPPSSRSDADLVDRSEAPQPRRPATRARAGQVSGSSGGIIGGAASRPRLAFNPAPISLDPVTQPPALEHAVGKPVDHHRPLAERHGPLQALLGEKALDQARDALIADLKWSSRARTQLTRFRCGSRSWRQSRSGRGTRNSADRRRPRASLAPAPGQDGRARGCRRTRSPPT
jgi:hypothetical protein